MNMDTINLIDASISAKDDVINEIIFTESGLYEIIDKTVIVIKKFLSELRAKAAKLLADVKSTIRRVALPAKLLAMKQSLKKLEAEGKSTVEMVDYNKMSKYYTRMAKELASKLKKPLMEQRYKDRDRFQDDMEAIGDMVDEFDDNMTKMSQVKHKIGLDKAISIVEAEIKGETLVYKSYIKALNDFDKQVADLEKLKRNSYAVSNKYLKDNHLGIFRRQLHKVGIKLHKWMSKMISTVVFFFA